MYLRIITKKIWIVVSFVYLNACISPVAEDLPLDSFVAKDPGTLATVRTPADSAAIDSLSNVLLDELVRLKAPLAELYNKGAQDKDIDDAERQLGFKLPADAVALFKWRNGIAFNEKLPLGSQWLFPLGTPASLETALEAHRYYGRNEAYRKQKLLLVFENAGGEMYFLDCNEQSRTFGQIWINDLTALEDGDPVMSVMYGSLAAFLKTMIRCYREGVYTFSVENYMKILERDFKREVSIARETNPDVEYWKKLSESIKEWPVEK